MSGEKRLRAFEKSAGVVLFITGVAKVVSGLGSTKALLVPDPILGIEFGQLMILVGAGEIVIALACFSRTVTSGAKLGLVAWMSTNFLVYRFGLWCVGWHRPCGCMGSLTEMLHLSPETADTVMKVVLVYLLAGSYGLLFVERRRRLSSAAFVKML